VLLLLGWIFAILFDTGPLYLLTEDWKTPLGKPPSWLKKKEDTAKPPAANGPKTNQPAISPK